jgi:hypothetical protein
VIALMKRTKGATLSQIMEATGWQKHTVRGFVSVLGHQGGAQIESTKNSGLVFADYRRASKDWNAIIQ